MKNSKLMLLFTVLLSLPVFPSISKAEETKGIYLVEVNLGVGQPCFRCSKEIRRQLIEDVQQIKISWLKPHYYDIVPNQILTGYYARIESWGGHTERVALGYNFGFSNKKGLAKLLFYIGGAYSEHRIGAKKVDNGIIISGQSKETFDLGVSVIIPIKDKQYFSIGYNHLSNGSNRKENIGNEILTVGLAFAL